MAGALTGQPEAGGYEGEASENQGGALLRPKAKKEGWAGAVTGQAETALARPSQNRCPSPLKERPSEGPSAGPALDPGGTRGGAFTGGNPAGGAGTSSHRGSRVPSPGALKGLQGCRLGWRIAGEGGTPSPRPMGATEGPFAKSAVRSSVCPAMARRKTQCSHTSADCLPSDKGLPVLMDQGVLNGDIIFVRGVLRRGRSATMI